MVQISSAAERIHQDSIICVTHCHRPVGEDVPLMLAGGVTSKILQFALDADVETGVNASVNRTEGWLRLAVMGIEQALADIHDNKEKCFLATTAQDIRRAKREGRAAIMLGTEGTRWLEGSLEPLRLLYRLGLRELQLTWAFPNAVVPDGKISAFGREVLRECSRLGIIVDVTHIPEAAFWEVMDLHDGPVIISHGSANGVTTDQNDEHLKAIAAKGGLIGIHFFTTYLGEHPAPLDVYKQVDYLADRMGIDHIALGVDFFPTEGAWRRFQSDQNTPHLRWAIPDFSEMPRITQCLVDQGCSNEDIAKILGGNFLRVCEQVLDSWHDGNDKETVR